MTKSVHVKWQPYIVTLNNLKKSFMIPMGEPGAWNQEQYTEEGKDIGTSTFDIYIIMWSFPGIMPTYYPGLRDILPDLGNILVYYLDNTTLISLLYWVSNCPDNMSKYYPGNIPKYYSTKYHYRNLHEV